MRRITLSVGLALGLLFLLTSVLDVWATTQAPLGSHCGGVGPLPTDDPDFCGCTWGEVLFRGQPMIGAVVTLTHGSDVVTGLTYLGSEPDPYYGLTAYDPENPTGARRGDVLTLTASFAGQMITRSFRAWPEADGEQHIVLAFPERGAWSPWVTGGYTRTLTLSGDDVWAGGPEGVISVSLSTGISVTHTLPWAEPSVRALAVGTDGHIWAAGTGGVAEFDGSIWHSHTLPLTGTPRALAVDLATGAVWVGGGDTNGSLTVYTGTWGTAEFFAAPVTALTIDEMGDVWVGSWGSGVFRQHNNGWTPYRATDGLASDDVLAAVAGGGVVCFGTAPYLSGGNPRGGIACYNLTMETWQTYTTTHGLPADSPLPQAPAPVYALAMDETDIPWAGTTDGVRFLADENWWAAYTTTHGLRPGTVQALVVGNGTAVAATPLGLDRLDPVATSGAPPVAQIDTVSPLTLTVGGTLTLSGEGVDGDESGTRIVAWDWSSSLNGPLCTAVTCTLPHNLFAPGVHSIELKVQDDEGTWSEAVTETVVVKDSWRVYLPLVLR